MDARTDPGMALFVDWSSRKQEVLQQAQAGWPGLVGDQVHLDLAIQGLAEPPMRLVFGLFLEQVPLAAANFYHLCAHSIDGLGEGGHPLTYRRSHIHRVEPGHFLEGGDITLNSGVGGDSIYGRAGFEDEPFGLSLRHDSAGLLSMSNTGPNSNRSQFLITLGPAPQLDGSHVIIGRLISGSLHLETLGAIPVDVNGAPSRPIIIAECGIISGWRRPPLPSSSSRADKVTTKAELKTEGEARRNAVAEAVAAALKRRSDTSDEPEAKRHLAAPSNSGTTKYGAMFSLPFASEIDGEGDDDDEDDD
ncbi:hypothetical protein AB1Y20_022049 [Prymnesium parvum]|uniref:PPIase cyclophilin-type domain-containing protein n=1 Tax=Prymnesium parvum TaxID=97485 RepID=A0AB34JHN6_PRYPA